MLKSIINIKNCLVKILEFSTIILIAVLVLDVVWQVLSRYVTKTPSAWSTEIATNTLIWVSLLAASLTYMHRGHLGVDLIVSKLNPKNKMIADIIAHLCVAFFAGYVLLYGGINLVALTLRFHELTPVLQMPKGYVFLAVPISGFFMVLFAIEHIIEDLLVKKKPLKAHFHNKTL